MLEILGRFFKFCNVENRRKFYISIAIGVVNSFFLALRIAAVAVILQALIAQVDGTGTFTARTIGLSCAIMAVSLAGAIVTKRFMSMLQTEAGYRTCAIKRIEIAEHLRYLPMGYFNANSLGYITSVTTNTMEQVGDVATRAIMMVTQGILDTLLIIVMIAFFDWRISLIAFAGFVLFQLVNTAMRANVAHVSQEKVNADTAVVENILEYIQGIAEVKAYNLTGSQSKKLNEVIQRGTRASISMELKCIPLANLQSLVAKFTGVAMLCASLGFFLGGTMTLSNCAVMLVCSFMLFSALEVGGNYSALLRAIDIGVGKAQKILDLPTMDIEGKEGESLARNFARGARCEYPTAAHDVAPTPPSPRGTQASCLPPKTPSLQPDAAASENEIRANGIVFSYGTKRIIDDVSLEIPERTTTAIVGPSGGGKTTLCHLLARFWDVDEGTVTLGGRNVRDYSMDSLMQHYSFVFQNVYLFHDTIANNIRFGEPDAPMEKVVAAAKKACCHDFISALPDGYDTVIGEGGASLSGGEKQRISIARAIMKDAPVIVLDEATANVDPENERDLMAAVSELTHEKTVIMIAHRLKTVRNADQILVVDKGRIAERGTHEELAKQGGIYARFIDSRREAVSWKL